MTEVSCRRQQRPQARIASATGTLATLAELQHAVFGEMDDGRPLLLGEAAVVGGSGSPAAAGAAPQEEASALPQRQPGVVAKGLEGASRDRALASPAATATSADVHSATTESILYQEAAAASADRAREEDATSDPRVAFAVGEGVATVISRESGVSAAAEAVEIGSRLSAASPAGPFLLQRKEAFAEVSPIPETHSSVVAHAVAGGSEKVVTGGKWKSARHSTRRRNSHDGYMREGSIFRGGSDASDQRGCRKTQQASRDCHSPPLAEDDGAVDAATAAEELGEDTLYEPGAVDSQSCSSCDNAEALFVSTAGGSETRRGRSRKREKREEYRRLRACINPNFIPLRTAASLCPNLAAYPVAAKSGTSTADQSATRLMAQADAVAAAATIVMAVGGADEEEETWRKSNESRSSAAGGRTGRFSAAERATVRAALRHYAVDNNLEGGTVEAAVEHLMTAQESCRGSPRGGGRRKTGGRALRFAAIARWLPQRSCASIYFFIRRSLCAHLGAKKCGPWDPEEVQTLVRMEAELRHTYARGRFARIAAVLNRTSSGVYDKWKEIVPCGASLARSSASMLPQAAAALAANAGQADHAKNADTEAAGGVARRVEELARDSNDAAAVIALGGENAVGRPSAAAAVAADAKADPTRRKGSLSSYDEAPAESAEAAGAAQREVGQRLCKADARRMLQQHPLENGEEERLGKVRRGRRGESSDDGGDGCSRDGVTTAADTDAAEAGDGREGVAAPHSRRRRKRRTEQTGQLEINYLGASTSAVEVSATRATASKTPPSSQKNIAGGSSDAAQSGAGQPRKIFQGELEAEQVKIGRLMIPTEEGKALSTTLNRRRRRGSGLAVQLLEAVQRHTGELLPATGISWSSMQRHFFPEIPASYLRHSYARKVVPSVLAKRMRLPAAEPVLLRFIVRCLYYLLSAGRGSRADEKAEEEKIHERNTLCESLAYGAPQLGTGGNAMSPLRASSNTAFPIIDSLCDVDWLEVLPFCPTQLPLLVFRRAVAALLPTSTGDRKQSAERLGLAQQVDLLKQRLELDGGFRDNGKDAALLLRAAIPQETLARAVRRKLRRENRKRTHGQLREKSTSTTTLTKRPPSSAGKFMQHLTEKQQHLHSGEHSRKLRGDKSVVRTAVHGGEMKRDAPDQCAKPNRKCDEDRDCDAMDEREEAREQAIEFNMTETEREAKWRQEEKLLGRTAVLAVLRKVGGKEIRRLRRRNRECTRLKEAATKVDCKLASPHGLSKNQRTSKAARLAWTEAPLTHGAEDRTPFQPTGSHRSYRPENSSQANYQAYTEVEEEQSVDHGAVRTQSQRKSVEKDQLRVPFISTPDQQQKEHNAPPSPGCRARRHLPPSVVEREAQMHLMPHSSNRTRRRGSRGDRPSVSAVEALVQDASKWKISEVAEQVRGGTNDKQQQLGKRRHAAPGATTAATGAQQHPEKETPKAMGTAPHQSEQSNSKAKAATKTAGCVRGKQRGLQESLLAWGEVEEQNKEPCTKALIHDKGEDQPEPKVIEGTDAIHVPDGEELLRIRDRKRKKSHRYIVDTGTRFSDHGNYKSVSSVDVLEGEEVQGYVRSAHSEQGQIAAERQLRRVKKKRREKNKNPHSAEGLRACHGAQIATERRIGTQEITDFSTSPDWACNVFGAPSSTINSKVLKENGSACIHQLRVLGEQKISPFSTASLVQQEALGWGKSQRSLEWQQLEGEEHEESSEQQEQPSDGGHGLTCEKSLLLPGEKKRRAKRRRVLEHHVAVVHSEDLVGVEDMHVGQEKKRQKKRKRKQRRADRV